MDKDAISFGISRDAWIGFDAYVRDRLIASEGLRRVAEIGAGANPTVPPSVIDQLGLDCTLVDCSATELAKAPAGYRKVIADLSNPDMPADGSFDLVFSRMLAEHVPDARVFHQNVWRMLRPGGRAFHFFPTLWSIPFAINWLLPHHVGERILTGLQPIRRRGGRHEKFPAYYHWCRGPSERGARRFESVGFDVVRYVGFFGHSGAVGGGPGYFDAIRPLRDLHQRIAHWLVHRPWSLLTSYAYLELRKPLPAEEERRAA